MSEEYVTTRKAAEIAKVTPGRIRQLLLKGQLKGSHFGRDWMIERRSLETFAAKVRKRGPKPS